MMNRVWVDVPAEAADVVAAAAALGVPPVIARLLCQRGLSDPERARAFCIPDRAAARSDAPDRRARGLRANPAGHGHGERIVIHGDYDVDGITSTVMLRRGIELLGGTSGTSCPTATATGMVCNRPRLNGFTPTAPV
jgi:single-stranded-DNA-specific exonuclease